MIPSNGSFRSYGSFIVVLLLNLVILLLVLVNKSEGFGTTDTPRFTTRTTSFLVTKDNHRVPTFHRFHNNNNKQVGLKNRNLVLLLLSGKNDDGDNKDGDDVENAKGMSFLQRITRTFGGKDNNNNNEKSNLAETTDLLEVTTSTKSSVAATIEPVEAVPVIIKELSPEELATKLRADAGKARLEAERMDAELTLMKISKLEKKLQKSVLKTDAAASTSPVIPTETIEQMQRELDNLQAKLRGEPPKPIIATAPTPKSYTATTTTTTTTMDAITNKLLSSSVDTDSLTISGRGFNETRISTIVAPFDQKQFEITLETVEALPNFMKKVVALALNTNVPGDNDESINITELALRMDMMDRLDFSFSRQPAPTFTPDQIEERRIELLENEKSWFKRETLHPLINEARQSGVLKDNATDFAIMVLEQEYYSKVHVFEEGDSLNIFDPKLQSQFQLIADEGRKDMVIEQWYPKCTRGENKVEPTSAQIQQLIADILPKASYTVNGKPDKVVGGYIIRGTTRLDGDTFVDKVDELLKRQNMDEKMTVLYTPDFTIFSRDPADVEQVISFDDIDPILYVTAPNIVRESRPISLSVVSAIGIATSWYLSLYPFLLNPIIAKRVDEQIALADANMTPDLSFLTDLSFPLFTTFVSIQLIHEIAHFIVASANTFKLSPPTFVPSIITGITSSVTTFRSLPKNKAAMFDFAISGPLAGMIASIATIAVGTQLTYFAPDTSLFPSLPLEILRQSTLGGGIINAILGNGALSVPEAAIGTAAVAGMTVPLHPVAIAGYISLVVNALNLLPVGTTDGGRVAIALFGRGSKLLIGQLTLIALLILGILGSDLFLFFSAFVIGFQTGNEVPARNEVDQIDFSRAALATATYLLAVLALVPFQ